jgi:putative transposase
MFVTLRGEPYVLWRAVDGHGIELDILLQKRRDKAAAKRFFKRMLAGCPALPKKIVTDQLRSYPAAKAELPELANVKHVFVKARARVDNRAENSHHSLRANASAGCEAFDCPGARKFSCRASVRSGTTSRSSGTCYALRSIANNSPHDLMHGDFSPALSKIRPPSSETRQSSPISRHTVGNVTEPRKEF